MKNAWYKTKLAKAILVLLSILCSVTMVVSVLWFVSYPVLREELLNGKPAGAYELSLIHIYVTLYETQVWTGIEILDYLLTQEKKKADQRNIKFQIETQRIDSLPFSDIEIVSIFGNLLDNAIEACEKIEIEERLSLIHIYPLDET